MDNLPTKRRSVDRGAIVLLVIFVVTCAAPGVRSVVDGRSFDVPTAAAFAAGALALALLAGQLVRTVRDARERQETRR